MKREDTTRVWRTLFEVTDWMRNINAGLIDQTFLNLTFNQLRMIKIVYVLNREFPEGVTLKVMEFTDYIKPNLSLADKEIDANFFQHKPYLDEFCADRGLKLSSLTAVHIEPMGVYSRKVKGIADVAEGAQVAIPNDPTNGGRALKVLETAGLIKLKPEAGILATVGDVAENPKKVKFIEIESAQLPRALDDVDLAVINSNYALGANLNPLKDAIAIEAKDSPYANVVAVRTGEENRAEFQKLKAALSSPELKKFLEEQYKGAVVPAF